jgi:hypothetical protein
VIQLLVPANTRRPDFLLSSGCIKEDANRANSATNVNGNFSFTPYKVASQEPFANSQNASELLMKMGLAPNLMELLSVAKKLSSKYNQEVLSNCVSLMENKSVDSKATFRKV